jgi:hypothetical protein
MSTFHQSGFNFDGMYLSYQTVEGERKFVARFKRGGMASFRNFLIKNFSIQEYFSMMEDEMSPLEILATKGFVMPKTAKILKKFGFEPNAAGQKAYIEAIISNRELKEAA